MRPGRASWSADPPPTVPAERTSLAWTRTVLTYGACVLLCTRLAAGSVPLLAAVAGLGAAATAGLAAAARIRHRRATVALGAGRPVAAPAGTAAVAGLTALLGLTAAVLVASR